MSKIQIPTRRRRKITQEMRVGVGGVLIPALHDAITSLRFLRRGFDVGLDPNKTELRVGRAFPPDVDVYMPFDSISRAHAVLRREGPALWVEDLGSHNGTAIAPRGWNFYRSTSALINVGDRVQFGAVETMALDERLRGVSKTLERWICPNAFDEVDAALDAVIDQRMLVLRWRKANEVLELAEAIHGGSSRRGFPFTRLEKPVGSPEAVDKLLTRAGCGVLFIDLYAHPKLPQRFLDALFSDKYHIWPIVVADSYESVVAAFGAERIFRKATALLPNWRIGAHVINVFPLRETNGKSPDGPASEPSTTANAPAATPQARKRRAKARAA